MPLTLRYVARSDVGLIREGNEDSGYAGPYLLAVADGMGGHAAGEVASQAAIEELVQAEHEATQHDPLDALSDAIASANGRIRQLIADDPSREGMGTTVTALLWTGSTLGMGHIGDSRAYLLRDGQISQLSHDHTFVQSLVDEGRITIEEAGVHPARSLILKALQGQGEVDPDLVVIDVVPGDRLLVCSDGLSGVVSDETLGETMSSIGQLDEVADELVRLALAGGAPDNVTLIIADVIETDTPRAPDDTAEAFLVGAAAGDHPPAKDRPHRRRPRAALRVLLGGEERPREPEDLEALRYAPRPPRRFRWVRRFAVLVAVVLLGWGALSVANSWVRTQYYVGNSNGDVVIFQGLSQEIGPIRLSKPYEIPPGLPVAALPTLYRNQVEETITAETIDDAFEIVSTLRQQACLAYEAQQPQEEAPAEPDPTGTPDPTRTPGRNRTPAPANTPDREPTASATVANEVNQTPAPNESASTPGGTPEPTETPEPPSEVGPGGWRPAEADLDCTEVG